MTNKPWMPLYVAEYLADTRHLGAAEHGAYMLLIMHYWVTGGLPDDDRSLARIACMDKEEWSLARPIIEPLFKAGPWKHIRVEKELAKAERVSAVRREAAEQKHAVARAHQIANAGTIASANALALAPAFAEQKHTQSHSHSQSPSKESDRGVVGDVKSAKPPRHGAVSRDKKYIYFRQGTTEYEAYADEYRQVQKIEPIANEHGGRWFKVLGEGGWLAGREKRGVA